MIRPSRLLPQKAAAIGADALMSATPYYNKTTQEGLFAPLLYDCRSGRTAVNRLQRPVSDGYGYLGETCRKLSEHPLIAGIKEASGDVAKASRIVEYCGEDLPVYSGNDDIAAPILSMGEKALYRWFLTFCRITLRICAGEG